MAIDDADPGETGSEGTAPETPDADRGPEAEPADPGARVGAYTWSDFRSEYGGGAGNGAPADAEDYLGFEAEDTVDAVRHAAGVAKTVGDVVGDRTVTVDEDLDEDAFFSMPDGGPTVTTRYDLEKAVPLVKKSHFREVDRYWVNKPYSFVTIFHSDKENEKKYYLIEPYLTEVEADLRSFLAEKLKTAIKYSDDDIVVEGDKEDRAAVIEEEMYNLLDRYDLHAGSGGGGGGMFSSIKGAMGMGQPAEANGHEGLEGIETRPEPVVLEEDADTLTPYQVSKILYLLKRDFIGYERIDGIKYDINVEDISVDGYDMPVFVYHSQYEQIITNVVHGKEELDEFVVKLAQRSGKGISKRQPQVDATLPDGSRAQLTLGAEVSDHGTNYTIRQFQEVPHTPIDLINWNTFSLDEMAFLWLCIENNKSLLFAGGTASGKTTSLNAASLFIPSKAKIVSIEDTREVELPQRNWVASVTRPSFSEDEKGDIDEFDLLEAALRQRPEYIVMGEIRGEEGRDLFQAMSTGHTTLTTFHADSVGEVIKRFTTEPINVSKTMFTALDLVSIQTATRVDGHKVKRNKNVTEINHYDPENDEINVQDVFQWQAETDEFLKIGDSSTLEEVRFDRGWEHGEVDKRLFHRKLVLAYLIDRELNTYAQVAATLQAFINDPDTILALMANDDLERSLEDLREMESVEIDIDPEKEELVPRPDPTKEIIHERVAEVLGEGESVLEEFRGEEPEELAEVLEVEPAEDIDPTDAGGGFAFEDRGEGAD